MSDFFTRTLPGLLAPALIAALLVLGTLHVGGVLESRSPVQHVNFVAFDIVKFGNAQRAVASTFLGKQDNTEAAGILANVSKNSREVIARVAGPDTVVLVKQATLTPGIRDITDDVLVALGLPTDVPTADPASYAIDMAPTWLRMTPMAKEKQRQEDAFMRALQGSGGNPLVP